MSYIPRKSETKVRPSENRPSGYPGNVFPKGGMKAVRWLTNHPFPVSLCESPNTKTAGMLLLLLLVPPPPPKEGIVTADDDIMRASAIVDPSTTITDSALRMEGGGKSSRINRFT